MLIDYMLLTKNGDKTGTRKEILQALTQKQEKELTKVDLSAYDIDIQKSGGIDL
jgi:hypothetical protein